MQVAVIKLTDEALMQRAAGFTINKDTKIPLARMYECEHSPERTQIFWVEMEDIPTFVSTHFVRHKIGVEHFVKSNREDRAGYTGDKGRHQPVNHAMLINATALKSMARKRLCFKAHRDTGIVMRCIKEMVAQVDPDLAKLMVRECEYRNGCHELSPCGWWDKQISEEYIDA